MIRVIKTTRKISKKVPIVLKGGTGSGFTSEGGHRGIPGYHGGSLPADAYTTNGNMNEFINNLREKNKVKEQPIRTGIARKLRKLFPKDPFDKSFVDVDVMLLDKARFDRYNEKWNLGLADEDYQKLRDEENKFNQFILRKSFVYEELWSVPGQGYESDHVWSIVPVRMMPPMPNVGVDAVDARNILREKYHIRINGLGDLPEKDAHAFISNIINTIERYPIVKKVVEAGALKEVQWAVPHDTYRPGGASAASYGDYIKVFDSAGRSGETFIHELGHCLEDLAWKKGLITQDNTPYKAGFDSGYRITSYAWANYMEDFAETFSAIADNNEYYTKDERLKTKVDYIHNILDKL
jgi:hypothetical protein